MKQKHGSRSTIVPGRVSFIPSYFRNIFFQKPITQIAALHDAGVTEDMSYCNEKSVLDESSNMNDTHDNDIVDERSLIQQGIPDRDINKILQRRKLEKLLKVSILSNRYKIKKSNENLVLINYMIDLREFTNNMLFETR